MAPCQLLGLVLLLLVPEFAATCGRHALFPPRGEEKKSKGEKRGHLTAKASGGITRPQVERKPAKPCISRGTSAPALRARRRDRPRSPRRTRSRRRPTSAPAHRW